MQIIIKFINSFHISKHLMIKKNLKMKIPVEEKLTKNVKFLKKNIVVKFQV